MFSSQKINSKLKSKLCKDFAVCLTVGTANSPLTVGARQSKAKQGLRMHICKNI